MAAYRACAACDRFGFVRNTAATAFDVFYWLKITNAQVTNFALLNSAPNRADYIDIWRSLLHCQLFRTNVSLQEVRLTHYSHAR